MTKKQKLKYYVVLFIFVLIYWFIKLTPLNFHDKGFFIRLVILSILIILPLLISLPKKKTESSTDQKNPFDFKNIQDIQLKISSFKDIFKQTSGLIWIPLILLVLLLVSRGTTSVYRQLTLPAFSSTALIVRDTLSL